MKGEPQQPMCGFSKAVVQILELHGAFFFLSSSSNSKPGCTCAGLEPGKYSSHNILEKADLRNDMKEYSYVEPMMLYGSS